MAAFDTLKLARILEGTGVPRENAEAFSLSLNEALEDSAKNGMSIQSLSTDQLTDLVIEISKQCGCPLQTGFDQNATPETST